MFSGFSSVFGRCNGEDRRRVLRVNFDSFSGKGILWPANRSPSSIVTGEKERIQQLSSSAASLCRLKPRNLFSSPSQEEEEEEESEEGDEGRTGIRDDLSSFTSYSAQSSASRMSQLSAIVRKRVRKSNRKNRRKAAFLRRAAATAARGKCAEEERHHDNPPSPHQSFFTYCCDCEDGVVEIRETEEGTEATFVLSNPAKNTSPIEICETEEGTEATLFLSIPENISELSKSIKGKLRHTSRIWSIHAMACDSHSFNPIAYSQ